MGLSDISVNEGQKQEYKKKRNTWEFVDLLRKLKDYK